MLQSNFSMLKTENNELQKRSEALSKSATTQDLRTQQVAEELVEAKGLVESMRNETANLKAEKKLWKDIQDRLSQDNENLLNDRNRLNGLITNLQSLQNERELTDSETRRRLQTQIESLDAELNSTKRKLNDEVEDAKKAQLRKEYDTQQNQKRIDDLVANLGSIREELAAARTAKDHLQARVDELSIELKSAEERVQALQPKPTPRPHTAGETPNDATNGADESITREQELEVEASELRRDLELAKSELENLKSQVEQYKAISQSSEEELQSMNESHDQYVQEMDRVIEERDTKIRDLEQRLEDITSELSTTNSELNSLRTQHLDDIKKVEEEKTVLESEITRLKDEDQRHATAAQFYQEDLRAQAEIAQAAQQNYECELLKHAEAAKTLQSVRLEHNQLRTEVVELRTEAEAAKATLAQGESNWEELRERYEHELVELRNRREDLNAQNKLLHQQLENVSSQVSALQQSRANFAEVEGDETSAASVPADRSVEDLREVIKYLRREKEIVDVQYELSIQESKRLKHQLDYSQSQLDEARLKLDQERQDQTDSARSSAAHKDLMEKLNELNLFRESSITLRSEARQAQAQLAEKAKRVEELMEQMQPLEVKVRELENEKETQDGEIKLLQEDRDRWQQRMQTILQKYDRVDPAEMESMREQISTLKAERDQLASEKAPLQEIIDGIPEQIRVAQEEIKAKWKESRESLVNQAKERNRIMVKEKNDKVAELQVAIKEKEELENQLGNIQTELETMRVERDQALAKAGQPAQTSDAVMESGAEEGQLSEQPSTTMSVEEKKSLEDRAQAAEAKVSELQAEALTLQNRISGLESQVVSWHAQNPQLNATNKTFRPSFSKICVRQMLSSHRHRRKY
jgi:nucleoprotein TPR